MFSLKYSDLSMYSDEELCSLASSGVREAEEILVSRYFGLVRICARPYYLTGGSFEDIIQEGLLGLLSAIRDFSPKRNDPFKSFAESCIKNRIFSGLKAATRKKHMPLNSYLSIDSLSEDGYHASDLVLRPTDNNPEDLILSKESYEELFHELKGLLSNLESNILDLYLEGLTVKEIALKTGRSPKSVDNAIWRVRRKVDRHLKHSR
jgi:RNA polymerase sporulation-specific sigma factor